MTAAEPIVLVGLRCVGKSTVGPLLARELGVGFVDLDDCVRFAVQTDCCADHAGTLAEWIVAHGWPAFREREALELEHVLRDGARRVVAAGGGIVERADNRRLLAARARVVWLREELPVLLERAQRDGGARPALTELNLADELAEVAERRTPLYASLADLTIDAAGRAATEVARELAARLATLPTSPSTQP